MGAWVTHLLCLVLGLAGGVAYGVEMVGTVASRVDPKHYRNPHGRQPVTEPLPERRARLSRGQVIALATLVAGLIVTGIGVQSALYASQQAEQRGKDQAYSRCLRDFANDLVDTIDARTTANLDLARAQKRKADALDRVVLTVVRQRATPPTATDQDFDSALAAFVQSRTALLVQERKTETVREQNPYRKVESACSR